MKNIILVTLSIFLYSLCIGQDNIKSEEIFEVRKNKYQIELAVKSLKSLWDNPTSSSVILKKKLQSGNLINVNKFKLARTFFSVNTQINFTEDPTRNIADTSSVRFHPSDVIEFNLGIGIEIQKQNRIFVHYYGLDGFINYVDRDDDITVNAIIGGVYLNQTNTTDRLLNSFRTGVQPFMGLKYYFTDQLNIGIETSIQLYYFNTTFNEINIKNEVIDGIPRTSAMIEDPVTSRGIGVMYNGIRFISIGYTF